MGWFTRTSSPPKPDPIGDICRSLAERPWEWEASTHAAMFDAKLVHVSGVALVYNHHGVWLANGPGCLAVSCSRRDDARLLFAINARAAALVSRPRYTFTQAATMLADAVKRGDEQAAYALADEVMEHARGNR